MFTKLSHKQESVTADSGYFYIPHRYRGGWVHTWKYLKQVYWEKIYIYIRGLLSVQSGVLPVYYSGHAAIYSILQ
jgi:hypothetical protein